MQTKDQLLGIVPNQRIRDLLTNLHKEAHRQERWLYLDFARFLPKFLLGKNLPWDRIAPRLERKYMAVDPHQGAFCYLLAKSMGAHRIVEFGTSFGVSTIYLAMAVQDNGGGLVIGTEVIKEKALQARRNLEEAGLSQFVDLRVGDALQTLRDIEGPVDLFLNDGFPPLALPVLKLVAPQLRLGGVVITDNVGMFRADYRGYVDYIRNSKNGFQSTLLQLNEGTEFSVKISAAQSARDN